MSNPRPEIATFQALSSADLLAHYRLGFAKIHPAVSGLSETEADRTFPSSDAGDWSCRVLLGHLADAEIAFVHRMRRAVAENRPAFTLWNEDDFVNAGLYRSVSISETLDLLRSLRNWTGSWLASLGAEDFQRIGLHPARGEQTLHSILAYATWHLEHHGWFLNRKMARLRP